MSEFFGLSKSLNRTIALLGEPLLELSKHNGSYALGVAGDVLNTAVAIAMMDVRTSLVTAVGKDDASSQVVDFSRKYDVNTDLVSRDENRQVGFYMINNDERGERTFSYWRSDSAAKNLFSDPLLLSKKLKQLNAIDAVYFSGITLALMTPESLTVFCDWLKNFRSANKKVIFDNNYRPALWATSQAFLSACERVLALTDMFLPSLDDVMSSIGIFDRDAALEWVASMGVAENVISDGVNPIILIQNHQRSFVNVSPALKVVDTTGAGDGFNGGYISSRLKGADPLQAIELGMRISAEVVAHKGAILPEEIWKKISSSSC